MAATQNRFLYISELLNVEESIRVLKAMTQSNNPTSPENKSFVKLVC